MVDNKNTSEKGRLGAIAKHKKYSQEGSENPNWKNGISKNNYHYKKIQKERYPERVHAREILGKAIKRKIITKPDNCEECKRRTSRLHGHHEDYSQPLKVKWLCVGCHRGRHV